MRWACLREDSCIEPYFKGLCVKHVSHIYRDSLIYDPFNVKVSIFIRKKTHSANMELMIFLGLYNLLSFRILLSLKNYRFLPEFRSFSAYF